jgi:membrane-bound lytic murein transglycosylase D
LQDSIYGYKDSVYFAKDLLKNPASYRRSSYKHAKPKGNYTKLYYTVQPGDNLGYIAEWYNVRASEIRYWNNIRGNLIRHGQKLIIYVPKNKYNYYKEINSLSFAQKQKRVGAPIPDSHSSGKVPATKGADDSYVYYKVDYGDTIWEIARKFSGVSDLDIMRLNNIRSGKSLKVGQVIKIKKK